MMNTNLLWLGWYGLFLGLPLLVTALAMKDRMTKLVSQQRATRDK
ncbi:hypothetical protein YTPLAS18_00200 [Nitrospira sp.]|nr:hypothetical protein YTPLAS18_00200 [Nitrospira sp.]